MVAIGNNLPPIEENYNFLNLPGSAKGVQGIGYTPVQYTGGGHYALYDMSLECGHNGKNQYRGEHLGLCNPICVA